MRERRGFWSSFQYITLIGGQLLALAVLVLLQSVLPRPRCRHGAGAFASRIGALLAFGVFCIRAA